MDNKFDVNYTELDSKEIEEIKQVEEKINENRTKPVILLAIDES